MANSGLIDLHTHTNMSDGDYSPQELLRIAKERGIVVIAVTDHDTVDGYDEALFTYAKGLGITLIAGIELSTIDEQSQQKIHVLGLFINPYEAQLREQCRQLRQERIDLARQVEHKLSACGFVLRIDELVRSGEIITKAHIARDVLENVQNQQELVKAHGKIPMQGEFIETWLIAGCPAFVPKQAPLLTHEAIEIIHTAGGIASCAHPSFNVMKGFAFEDMCQLILRNRFDAVEAINIQYDKEHNDARCDMVADFSDFAARKGLLVSGGSDYHSDNDELWGARTELGMVNEEVRVTKEVVRQLTAGLPRL